MTGNLRADLADLIRREDGNNTLKPATLALAVEDFLQDRDVYTLRWRPLAEFIGRINPDKTMGAAALADAIVDEFELDKETR